MQLFGLIPLNLILSSFGIGLLYFLSVVIRRLYFHPLAKFPGPKLAAMSYWPEFYYDVVLSGRYIWRVQEMHEKYGPIVRISPDQLNVSDPDFHSEIFASSGRKRDRWAETCQTLNVDLSTLSTAPHDLHKLRRSALNPFFSKAAVRSLQPLMDYNVDIFMDRLKGFQDAGGILPINRAYAAFTNDVVTEYAFGHSNHRLLEADFDPKFHDNMVQGMKAAPMMRFLRFLPVMLDSLPRSITKLIAPAYIDFLDEKETISEEVKTIIGTPKSNTENPAYHTMFREILDSKLPPQEKSLDRLVQDATVTVAAGTLTTAWALSVATYYILSTPYICQRVRDELEAAIPEPSQRFDLATLENLPYLSACIQEALRMSYGTSNRMLRQAPDEVLVYKDGEKTWYIPKGTPISMCPVFTHNNPKIYPQPKTFRPERWIENTRLDRYQTAFGKGARQCVGINVAYAELYLMLSVLFRNYGTSECQKPGDKGILHLFETTSKDVEIDYDAGVPAPYDGSKGVRVKVLKV